MCMSGAGSPCAQRSATMQRVVGHGNYPCQHVRVALKPGVDSLHIHAADRLTPPLTSPAHTQPAKTASTQAGCCCKGAAQPRSHGQPFPVSVRPAVLAPGSYTVRPRTNQPAPGASETSPTHQARCSSDPGCTRELRGREVEFAERPAAPRWLARRPRRRTHDAESAGGAWLGGRGFCKPVASGKLPSACRQWRRLPLSMCPWDCRQHILREWVHTAHACAQTESSTHAPPCDAHAWSREGVCA